MSVHVSLRGMVMLIRVDSGSNILCRKEASCLEKVYREINAPEMQETHISNWAPLI